MSDIDDQLLSDVADVAQHEERVEITAPETKTETNTDTKTVEEDDFVGDEVDYDRRPWDEREHETEETEEETESETEPSKTETEQAEPEAQAEETQQETQADDNAWISALPPAPLEFNLPKPEFDEDGQLTNMTGEEFINYTVQAASHQAQITNWNNTVMNRALDEAEKILPEIKTNPKVREMVQNQVVANTMNGKGYTAVDAAREIKSLLGDATSQGAQNERTSITIQKNAAIETPSNQRKSTPSKADALAKRLKSGDPSAHFDLMELWIEEGKV